MRPKNELERHMVALAEKLPPITDKQRRYAYDHCFAARAVYKVRKAEVRCLCCGQTAVWDKDFISAFIDTESYDCLYCGRIMPIEQHSKSTEYYERKHYTIITTFQGYQVARTFEVTRWNNPKEHFAQYGINEIYQNWILPDGREVITGRQCHRSAFSLTFDYHKPIDIRHHNASTTGAYAMDDLYDICGNTLYPKVRVTPLLKRNGWTNKLIKYRNFYALTEAMKRILTIPEAEMLVKTGQLDIFLYMMRRGDRTVPFLHSIRIANRNHYIVKDASMWFDMLTMAAELGRDTHNPKIVCPDNLRSAHDALLKPITRKRDKERAERELKRIRDWEIRYKESKAPYFGVCFGNDKIKIAVIQSVADMKAEGEAMHHCVFNAQYYRKDDSLILSARNNAGKRIETIELSLKTFEVLQSRGYCNQLSKHHDEIVQLVEKNINIFKQIKSKTA